MAAFEAHRRRTLLLEYQFRRIQEITWSIYDLLKKSRNDTHVYTLKYLSIDTSLDADSISVADLERNFSALSASIQMEQLCLRSFTTMTTELLVSKKAIELEKKLGESIKKKGLTEEPDAGETPDACETFVEPDPIDVLMEETDAGKTLDAGKTGKTGKTPNPDAKSELRKQLVESAVAIATKASNSVILQCATGYTPEYQNDTASDYKREHAGVNPTAPGWFIYRRP